MPSAQVGESLIWATTDETWGLIQDFTVTESAQTTQAPDADGDIVGASYYGITKSVSGTYLFKADLNSPNAHVGDGTLISVTDADVPDFFVTSSTINKVNTEFKSITFEGENYPDLGS